MTNQFHTDARCGTCGGPLEVYRDIICEACANPMNAYNYTCRFRPILSMRLPDGFDLVERGTAGEYPLRRDLPDGATRYDVVRYRRPLTDAEKRSFDLEPV